MNIQRIITSHAAKDTDGTLIQVLRDDIPLRPVLGGTAYMAPLFSSMGLPAVSTHQISTNQIDETASRVSGVALPGGTNAQVTHIEPGVYIKMHRTNSIDYNIILYGSATLITPSDDGEDRTEVTAGDIVIQRGTLHAWQAGPDGVRWCTVVVAAEPVKLPCGGALEEVDFK